jgi:hypothetical protein
MSTMQANRLRSISEAGKELGVSRLLVGELVKLHSIPTHPLPRNGAGKGLDSNAMKRLRRLLNRQTV